MKKSSVFLVVGVKDDGSIKINIGGGSSSPARPRVYDSLEKAQRYFPDGSRGEARKWSSEKDLTYRIIEVEL